MIAQTLCALNINVSNKAALIQPAKSENIERLFCEVVSMVSRNWTTRTSIHCRQCTSTFFSITAEKKQRAERHGMSTTWTTWPQRASCTAEAKSLKSLTCHALDVGTSLKSLTCHLCFLWVQYWNQRWRWIQVIPGLGRRLYKPLETKARLAARHVACINVTVALKHVESCYYHRFIRSCKFHWWNSKTWEAWSAPKDRANDTIL